MKSSLLKQMIFTTVLVAAFLLAVLVYLQKAQTKTSPPVEREAMVKPSSGRNPITSDETSQIAMIMNPRIPQEDRIKSVRELPGSLSPAFIQWLFEMFGKPKYQDDRSWYLICNEIMEVLRTRSLGEGVYSTRMLGLIRNQAADPVMRDYASQHLVQWIAGINPEQRETDERIATTVFESLCQEIERPENAKLTLVGTGMQALADAATIGDAKIKERKEEVGELAVEIAKDESAAVSIINRSSAIQAAARLNAPGISEVSRTYAIDRKAPIEIRLSSIAALGLTGTHSDIAILEKLRKDDRLRYPAEAAIKRLKTKTHN